MNDYAYTLESAINSLLSSLGTFTNSGNFANVGNFANFGDINVAMATTVLGEFETSPADYDGLTITPSPSMISRYYHNYTDSSSITVDLDTNGFSGSTGAIFSLTCDNMVNFNSLSWVTSQGIFAGSAPSNLSGGETVEVRATAGGLIFRVY